MTSRDWKSFPATDSFQDPLSRGTTLNLQSIPEISSLTFCHDTGPTSGVPRAGQVKYVPWAPFKFANYYNVFPNLLISIQIMLTVASQVASDFSGNATKLCSL